MAKFCTRCGKPLEEGEICNCQLKKENEREILNIPVEEYKEETDYREYTMNRKEPQQRENVVSMLIQVWQHIVNILKKPAVYGTSFVNKGDTKSAWGIIGFHACLQAFFIVIVLQRLNSLIGGMQGIFGMLMKEMNFDNFLHNTQGFLTISLLKGFLLTVILSIVLSAIYAGLLYGISRVMGQNTSFQKMLCVSAVRSVACMIVLAAVIILFILNSTIGILFFFLGEILGVCYTMAVMPKDMEENKKVFIVFLSLIVFVIVSNVIVLNYIPFYMPDIVRNAFDQLKMYLRNPYTFYNKYGGLF